MRGKGSEGIDFSDEAARGVFIIGIPFPLSPNIDIKINLKMKYLDQIQDKKSEKSISGQYWYDIQAVKSINQGIGRVMRHKKDYGVIGLFDSRFCKKPQVKSNLSDWAREVLSEDSFDVFEKKVSKFFNAKKKENKKNNEINGESQNESCKEQSFLDENDLFRMIKEQEEMDEDALLAAAIDEDLGDDMLLSAIEKSLKN